jgi:hypothetical protein
MSNDPEKLTDANPDDLIESLAFALRYDGRKRTMTGAEFMARITAERLVKYLDASGYVVKKKLPMRTHSSANYQKHLTD